MCNNIENIHNLEFENIVATLMANDIKKLAKKTPIFIKTNCPACKQEEASLYYNVFGLTYYKCHNCETVFLNPCPDEKIIMRYLNNSKGLTYWREHMPAHVTMSRKEKLYKDRVNYISKHIDNYSIQKSRFLDVGGGRGELVEEMIKNNLQFKEYIIIEPQPLTMNLPKVRIIHKAIEEIDEKVEANIVVAFEVLEHIIDPHSFFKNVNNLLAKDGIFILSTPNINGFEITTLKEKTTSCWFDHIRLYNPKSLKYLLEKNGFEILLIETPGELDIEIVKRIYDKGEIDFSSNPALQFLMKDGNIFSQKFQSFLVKNNLSSHMKCVARKNENIGH